MKYLVVQQYLNIEGRWVDMFEVADHENVSTLIEMWQSEGPPRRSGSPVRFEIRHKEILFEGAVG